MGLYGSLKGGERVVATLDSFESLLVVSGSLFPGVVVLGVDVVGRVASGFQSVVALELCALQYIGCFKESLAEGVGKGGLDDAGGVGAVPMVDDLEGLAGSQGTGEVGDGVFVRPRGWLHGCCHGGQGWVANKNTSLCWNPVPVQDAIVMITNIKMLLSRLVTTKCKRVAHRQPFTHRLIIRNGLCKYPMITSVHIILLLIDRRLRRR